jgi:hypothetical protein
MTQQEFLYLARQRHGDFYGYERTIYVHSKQKIIVICPTHGAFPVMPLKHLAGQHCKRCSDLRRSKAQAETVEDFIRAAVIKHGTFYGYGRVQYVNRNTRVVIDCPLHGSFRQKPMHHLRGSGCQTCALESMASKLRYTAEEFIEEAMNIHGAWYDYSEVKYEHSHIAVRIGCPLHGFFPQTPGHHLQGTGCPHALRNSAKPTGT